MFYVYILKSQKDDKLYIGFTNDLKRRFSEHNKGQSFATKNRKPFTLIYYEAYHSSRDARIREVKLKKFKNSYNKLKERLQYSLMMSVEHKSSGGKSK